MDQCSPRRSRMPCSQNAILPLCSPRRERAAEYQERHVRRVAQALGRDDHVVTAQLEEIVDRVEIRITRSSSVLLFLDFFACDKEILCRLGGHRKKLTTQLDAQQ